MDVCFTISFNPRQPSEERVLVESVWASARGPCLSLLLAPSLQKSGRDCMCSKGVEAAIAHLAQKYFDISFTYIAVLVTISPWHLALTGSQGMCVWRPEPPLGWGHLARIAVGHMLRQLVLWGTVTGAFLPGMTLWITQDQPSAPACVSRGHFEGSPGRGTLVHPPPTVVPLVSHPHTGLPACLPYRLGHCSTLS